MRGLKPLSIAATLMATVSAVSANPVPDDLHDDEPEAKEDKKGGNAIDKTTAAGTAQPMTGAGSLSPEGYKIMGEFWGSMLVGDYAGAAWAITEREAPEADSSSTFSWLAPADGPAESILDQMDESGTPLPMVGEPGSEVTVAPEAPTPPPESFLDYVDTAQAPQPAVSPTQDVAKPAVNRAPKPAVVEPPQK
jgi:hypothetical protein